MYEKGKSNVALYFRYFSPTGTQNPGVNKKHGQDTRTYLLLLHLYLFRCLLTPGNGSCLSYSTLTTMICCVCFSNVSLGCWTTLESTLSFQLSPLGKWLSRWALETQRKNMSLSWGFSLVQGMKELQLSGWSSWVGPGSGRQVASSCFVSQF